MATPFGFSAGDIAMAIKLIAQVAGALKETGGAASDYHEALNYLQGLLLTLQHLQKLDTASADPSLANAVRALTAAAEQPVREFMGEMSKFGGAMGSSSLKAGARKAQWAIVAAKKAEKLRARIVAQMQPVHLLLESQTLKSFNTAAKTSRDIQQSVEGQAAQQVQFNQTLLETLATLQKTVEETKLSRPPPTPQEDGPKDAVVQVPLPPPPSNSAAELMRLGQQLCVVILHLLRDIQRLLTLLMIVSPQLLMHMKFFYQAMIRAPGWLLDENIHFENALGEKRSLPFAYFRHMKVFGAFLEADFQGKPGDFQVTLQHYQILTPSGIRLNDASWTRSVRPGARIYMSINIPRHVDEIVPRRRSRDAGIWQYNTCPDCGLQFFAMPRVKQQGTKKVHAFTTGLRKKREVSGTPVYKAPSLLSPSSAPHPAKNKSRILSLDSLDSGEALPFKRMHIFGRAKSKPTHEEGRGDLSTPSLLNARTIARDKTPTLTRAATSHGRYRDRNIPTIDVGNITTDTAGSLENQKLPELRVEEEDLSLISQDTEKPFRLMSAERIPERTPLSPDTRIRCNDMNYHIRPIISMVTTTSDNVQLWFSRSDACSRLRKQTLTCQYVNCERKFTNWDSFNLHLENDHKLGGPPTFVRNSGLKPPSKPPAPRDVPLGDVLATSPGPTIGELIEQYLNSSDRPRPQQDVKTEDGNHTKSDANDNEDDSSDAQLPHPRREPKPTISETKAPSGDNDETLSTLLSKSLSDSTGAIPLTYDNYTEPQRTKDQVYVKPGLPKSRATETPRNLEQLPASGQSLDEETSSTIDLGDTPTSGSMSAEEYPRFLHTDPKDGYDLTEQEDPWDGYFGDDDINWCPS